MMMRRLTTFSILLLVSGVFADVQAKEPRRDVLGIRLDVSRAEAHRRLEKMGRMDREQRGRQEVWTLEKEPHFASVLIGYDAEFKVRYVTAIAREGGRRVPYSEIASLKGAYAENVPGHFKYTWEVKARGKYPAYYVILMGSDPQYLTSLSIKKKQGESD
jgi:hypothetical protein